MNVIQRGDVLLVSTSVAVTPEGAAEIKDRLMELLPGIADVFVITGVTSLDVYREGRSRRTR